MSEFSFTVFYSVIASEIYKGNSKKFQWKIQVRGIFQFWDSGLHSLVHTFLLTPVLSHILLSHAICHIRNLWHTWHIWQKWQNDIHHMTLCAYGVMVVKITVRTSGIQATIPNHINNNCKGKKWKISPTYIFLFNF